MAVSNNVRASNVFIEIQGIKLSFASLFIKPWGAIIGLYDPAKTSIVDYAPLKVVSAEDVGDKCGFGSHMHRQALAFPSSAFTSGNGVTIFPVPDAGGAVVADETIIFTGAATSAGTLYFSIGGVLVTVPVINADTITDIGDALDVAIAALRDIAVTSLNAAGTVTIDSKFLGTAGNEIKIVQNPSGDVQANAAPAGITVAIENADGYLDGGTGDPDIEDIFFDTNGDDILGDNWYTDFTMPFQDVTNLGYISAAGDKRIEPDIHRPFGAYVGYTKETYAAALALPATINNEFIGPIWDNRINAPSFELAAALTGRILAEKNLAPNRPYKNTKVGLEFDDSVVDKNYGQYDALFRAGMGVCKNPAGTLIFGDIALSYRTTDLAADTEEWFDAVSLGLRQAKAYSIEQVFNTDPYTRAVVVDDNAVTTVDFAIAPKDVISDMTKLIEELWGPNAWSKNIESVIAGLTAEINSSFGGRIDGTVTDNEAKALRIIAMEYAFLF